MKPLLPRECQFIYCGDMEKNNKGKWPGKAIVPGQKIGYRSRGVMQPRAPGRGGLILLAEKVLFFRLIAMPGGCAILVRIEFFYVLLLCVPIFFLRHFGALQKIVMA